MEGEAAGALPDARASNRAAARLGLSVPCGRLPAARSSVRAVAVVKVGLAALAGGVAREPLCGPGMRPEDAGHRLLPSRLAPVAGSGVPASVQGADPAAKATNAGERLSSRRLGVRNCGVLRVCGIDSLATEGAAMPAEELVRACLEELRAFDGVGIARDLAEANRVALLGTEGVASVLVSTAVGVQDGDRERSLELFEALIGEARQDEEGRGRIGAMFPYEAATSIQALVAEDGLTTTSGSVRGALGNQRPYRDRRLTISSGL